MYFYIVSGIPVVKAAMADKFVGIFRNGLLAKRDIGDKHGLVDISLGMEKEVGNQTVYLTYKTIAEAKVAFNKLNNLKFYKDHRMSCVWVNDLRTVI